MGVFPDRENAGESCAKSSPHAWGCFQSAYYKSFVANVFPTCVGVFLGQTALPSIEVGLPHMRGGVSMHTKFLSYLSLSSPHAWGCFRQSPKSSQPVQSLPHMRGGVSRNASFPAAAGMSSPHAWGCFWRIITFRLCCSVFPTCVGVFLDFVVVFGGSLSLPHMRGGVSRSYGCIWRTVKSSPHAWGCFLHGCLEYGATDVFPTCVGVFLKLSRSVKSSSLSSPHAWGCFTTLVIPNELALVFPTCVGVFPSSTRGLSPS